MHFKTSYSKMLPPICIINYLSKSKECLPTLKSIIVNTHRIKITLDACAVGHAQWETGFTCCLDMQTQIASICKPKLPQYENSNCMNANSLCDLKLMPQYAYSKLQTH